ncbi:MAG: hypothetical protein CBC55_00730 [Gammaproteobacteria bacterium TMED95]|nr:MAG: hypothetical protein CBC55_00730 [Gammaproteobacteria bacterium TMED95]|tara:strand:- start:7776 stop:8639 length:864 start_codon:yes stop_codon:yes gene_type:complete
MQKEIQTKSGAPAIHHIPSETAFLSAEEERTLILAAKKRDGRALQKLSEAFAPFINKIATQLNGYEASKEDLLSEGKVGLIKAVYAYDKKLTTRLSTFAYQYIRSEMMEYLIRDYSIVKKVTTKTKRKLFFSIRKRINDASRINPSLELNDILHAISVDMGIDFAEVQEMAYYMVSQDVAYEESANDDEDPSAFINLVASQKNATNSYFQPEKMAFQAREQMVKEEFKGKIPSLLSEKQLDIVSSRHLCDVEDTLTLKDLAARHAISKERVRQIEKEALGILKKSMH